MGRLARIVAMLGGVVLVPVVASAQAELTGLVRDTSGARAAGRDGRGQQPGADRESPVGRDRRNGALPDPEPPAGHVLP